MHDFISAIRRVLEVGPEGLRVNLVPCHRIVEIARAAARQIEVGIIFVAVLDAPRHEGIQFWKAGAA
jgi:hypothetical protein